MRVRLALEDFVFFVVGEYRSNWFPLEVWDSSSWTVTSIHYGPNLAFGNNGEVFLKKSGTNVSTSEYRRRVWPWMSSSHGPYVYCPAFLATAFPFSTFLNESWKFVSCPSFLISSKLDFLLCFNHFFMFPTSSTLSMIVSSFCHRTMRMQWSFHQRAWRL